MRGDGLDKSGIPPGPGRHGVQAIPVNALSSGSLVANGTSSGAFQAGFDFLYDYSSGAGTGNIWGQTQNTAGGSILP